MQTDFKERFAQFFSHIGESQASFAQRAGIQQVTVSQLLKGRSEASLKTINKLHAAFPNLNIDWLLEEKGEMLHDEKASAVVCPALSADPVPSSIEASPLAMVADSKEVLELKEENKQLKEDNRWLREQLNLWQRIATSGGVDLTKHAATGIDGSFNADVRLAAEYHQPVPMWIHGQQPAAKEMAA